VLDSVFTVSTVGDAVIVTVSCTDETFIVSGKFIACPPLSRPSQQQECEACLGDVRLYTAGRQLRRDEPSVFI
jgi:hypothetical protein